jgi:hypothetical protein
VYKRFAFIVSVGCKADRGVTHMDLRLRSCEKTVKMHHENFPKTVLIMYIGSLTEMWSNEYLLKESYWDINQKDSSQLKSAELYYFFFARLV